MEVTAEDVEFTHPEYDENKDHWQFLRDSFKGEETMKAHSQDMEYIMVPAAMLGYGGDKTPAYHYVNGNREANAYIKRARYPEVCAHALEIAKGKSFSREPEFKEGDKIKDILDEIWADGSDFQTGVLKALTEALVTRRGGLFVNLNKENDAVIHIYPAENVVNWNRQQADLKLVVLEDMAANDNPFDHEPIVERLVLGLDNDSGNYFAERWQKMQVVNDKGKTEHDWVRKDERVNVTMRQSDSDTIPYFPMCGWDESTPPFNALAKTSLAYFRASAEYNHIMWWAATPQPYIKFGENGGFWGVDEFAAGAVGDDMDDMGGGETDIEIKWGASAPILLREGSIDFAAAPSGALSAHEKRLEKLREEMSGLGARAFQNRTNANQTAETERMQQSSEGSVIHLVMKEVAKSITLAVRAAAAWRGLKGAEDFVFMFNPNISFEPFNLDAVPGLQGLHAEGYIARKHVRDYLRKVEVIPVDLSDEDLDEMISEEGPLGGGFGDDTVDPLAAGDQLGADLDDELTEDEGDLGGANDDDLEGEAA